MKWLFPSLYFFILFPFLALSQHPDPLSINIFCAKNGKGLETDRNILSQALQEQGHQVHTYDYWENSTPSHHADINIFCEMVNPERFCWAKHNWLIPNPEWYQQDLSLIDSFDLILCKTKECERIFKEMQKKTYYLGFISPDCYQENSKKFFSLYIHIAGGSLQKGTDAVLTVWKNNPEFPHLLVIKQGITPFSTPSENLHFTVGYLPKEQMKSLQNQCGIHICTSETEGFGHYIMEALSVGAVVITTDAPPMNEFITDPRCLVPYVRKDKQRLATTYFVDPVELEKKIKALIQLPKEELEAIGLKNRQFYLKNKEAFDDRLKILLSEISFFIKNKDPLS